MTPLPTDYWHYRITQAVMSLSQSGVESFPFETAMIYSGHPPYRCDPTAVQIKGLGPIPPGWWLFYGPPFTSPHTGLYVLRIVPDVDTVTYNRTSLEFHGENGAHVGLSSDGCLVTPEGRMDIRQQVWESGIRQLLVEAA